MFSHWNWLSPNFCIELAESQKMSFNILYVNCCCENDRFGKKMGLERPGAFWGSFSRIPRNSIQKLGLNRFQQENTMKKRGLNCSTAVSTIKRDEKAKA